ncbi:nucleoid DNA-binding protein [Altererythrobacter atlanticus]|nr:nucleoid DNA-binding protein [Croceibacterium atlanticum]
MSIRRKTRAVFHKSSQFRGIAFDRCRKTRSISGHRRAIQSTYSIQDNRGGFAEMNKNELIGAVADTSGLTRNDATKAVESVFDTITAALSKGDEVRLVGFGTFSVAKRKASTGRNPRTGEPMTIKASTQPKFKAGKGLKDAVN